MRYIKFSYGNGYCGCDDTSYEVFPDDVTDAEIQAYGDDIAFENAEQYQYRCIDENDEEAMEEYEDGIWCDWEEISEEQYIEGR